MYITGLRRFSLTIRIVRSCLEAFPLRQFASGRQTAQSRSMAALDVDRTASDVMEEAAKQWLERHKHKK
jgi:Lon protease-like protein